MTPNKNPDRSVLSAARDLSVFELRECDQDVGFAARPGSLVSFVMVNRSRRLSDNTYRSQTKRPPKSVNHQPLFAIDRMSIPGASGGNNAAASLSPNSFALL